MIKSGGEGISIVLQLWSGGRLAWEIHAPKSLHGSLVNDGYFSKGVAWSPDESGVAYIAEVSAFGHV